MTPRIVLLVGLILVASLAPAFTVPRYDIEVLPGLLYAPAAQPALALDLYRPLGAPGPRPLVLAIHGGSWVQGNRSEMRPLAMLLAAQGYATAAIDYRLAPDHPYPAQLEDARLAAAWLSEHADAYGLDTRHVAVVGASAGAQIAALLALIPHTGVPTPAAVVDLAGPMDFTIDPPSLQAEIAVRLYLGASRIDGPVLYREASPISHITPEAPPFLLIHGTADQVVPWDQSQRMAAALAAAHVPARLLSLTGAGHALPSADTPAGREALASILAFLGMHLEQAHVPIPEG